jgi:hypothetical protein
VFLDPQSAVGKYKWSIGSQPGYDDIMEPTITDEECDVSDEDLPLHMLDGHSYYVSVRVCATTLAVYHNCVSVYFTCRCK